MNKIVLQENEKQNLIEDLLNILVKENEQKLPPDLTMADKRWLVSKLMFARSIGDLDDEFLKKQDKLLSYENLMSGIKCAEDFIYKKRVAFAKGEIWKFNVDAIVIFTDSLFGVMDRFVKCVDNTLSLRAGLQLNRDLAEIMKSDNGLISFTKPYVVKGYNLPARHIVKIVLPVLHSSFSEYEKDRLKTNLKNLFNVAKIEKWKTLAVNLTDFPSNYPKDVLKTIIVNECKNLNKLYKTKINIVFVDDDSKETDL